MPDKSLPLPTASDACRFGQWLGEAGRKRYGRYAAFAAVSDAHEAFHRLGRNSCNCMAKDEARPRAPNSGGWKPCATG